MNDTVRREHQDKLGEEFGTVYHGLWNDWAWGLLRIQEFRELFSRVTHVELLNAVTGGGFLWDVQHILWDDLMLRVSRLTDPVRSAGKDNLTVQRLPDFCEDPGLRDEVKSRVDAAVDAAEFARDSRNRRISHADLSRTLKPNAEPLAPVSLRRAAAALDAVHVVLNTISVRLMDAELMNEVAGAPRARAFVSYVKQLVEAVQYIDSLIDPGGKVPITDCDAASAFLRRLGYEPTLERASQIIELREAARRFRRLP